MLVTWGEGLRTVTLRVTRVLRSKCRNMLRADRRWSLAQSWTSLLLGRGSAMTLPRLFVAF